MVIGYTEIYQNNKPKISKPLSLITLKQFVGYELKMETKNLLQVQLERYINRTLYHPEWGVYFIKELVGRIRNMKIEIYSNDHNPPHFHVKSSDHSINAVFRLDNCELIKGSIGTKDKKRIEAFYDDKQTKILMKDMWNKSKDNNRKL